MLARNTRESLYRTYPTPYAIGGLEANGAFLDQMQRLRCHQQIKKYLRCMELPLWNVHGPGLRRFLGQRLGASVRDYVSTK